VIRARSAHEPANGCANFPHDRVTFMEALDREIVALFAQVFALTARALTKLAEFDRCNFWAQQGYQSCAHWMNFRLSMSLGTAREHVRVARALEALPKISAAFSAGTISYSKARALTRIATATTRRTCRSGIGSCLSRPYGQCCGALTWEQVTQDLTKAWMSFRSPGQKNLCDTRF